MSDVARVVIEESQIGGLRWGVFIERPTRILGRTLWDRYLTQGDADRGAAAAKAYLLERGEAPTK